MGIITGSLCYSMVKQIFAVKTLSIPPEVTLTIDSRTLTVSGRRGELRREFRHLMANMYLLNENGKTLLKVEAYFVKRTDMAALQTLCSHVTNMINGVTKGFMFKLRMVYAHFPINVALDKQGKLLEIRNFLGEKKVRLVNMLQGVVCERSSVKDELVLHGNDIELVSRSAARIRQSCLVKNKDLRKFHDGIYVAERALYASVVQRWNISLPRM